MFLYRAHLNSAPATAAAYDYTIFYVNFVYTY